MANMILVRVGLPSRRLSLRNTCKVMLKIGGCESPEVDLLLLGSCSLRDVQHCWLCVCVCVCVCLCGTDDWTLCQVCGTRRPPLSHHCRRCGQCVRRMDHHCPWSVSLAPLHSLLCNKVIVLNHYLLDKDTVT